MRIPSHDPQIDFEIRADSPSDAFVVREQFCENVYELNPTDLEDTKIVFDVGANIGAFSLYAAKKVDGVKVFAFEPDPDNYDLLVKNNELNKRKLGKSTLVPKRFGLSDYERSSTLMQKHGGSHLLGVNAPVGVRTEAYDNLPENIVNVDLITLRQSLELAQTEYVDVLKIDIEGHEYALLLGPDKHLLNRFRYITLEFEPSPMLGQLLETLAETHNVQVIGKASQGGYIHARRY